MHGVRRIWVIFEHMNLGASLLELQRHVAQRGLMQKVQVALEGSHIHLRLLEEGRSMFIGYRAGFGHYLVSDPSEPPTTFFQLDRAAIASLLPPRSGRAPRERAKERLKDYELVVSYARSDEAIVKSLVTLLRVTDTRVFRDVDSIPPGDFWRQTIQDAISGCTVLILFWCSHAAISAEVEREYELALQLNKRVVPVLLDRSELNGSLRERQHIDMRHFHQHEAKVTDDERDPARARDEVARPRSQLTLRNDAALYLAEELGEVLEAEPPNTEQSLLY